MVIIKISEAQAARFMKRYAQKSKSGRKKASLDYAQMLIDQLREFPATKEYRFHGERRWRFDIAFEPYKIAVEIEGGIFSGGRHTRGVGFLADMEKYNSATALGWRIFRVIPAQVKDGSAATMLRESINQLGYF